MGHAFQRLYEGRRRRLLERHERAGRSSMCRRRRCRTMCSTASTSRASGSARRIIWRSTTSYGMENTRATHDGLAKLRTEHAALRDDARQLCGRTALRRDVDGRQFQHLESSADDDADAREPGTERLCYGGRGCGRIRRNAAAGSADEVAGDRGLSADRSRPHRQGHRLPGAVGPAARSRRISAAATSKSATG